MNLTDEAIEALYKLCEGDMRKIVNMLQVLFFFLNLCKNLFYQSLHISLGKNSKDLLIEGEYVYKLTANASPVEIEKIMSILLNEDLEKAYEGNFH